MKKLLLSIAIFVCVFNVNSQTLKLKSGPSITEMKWNHSDDFYSKKQIGFHSSAGIEYLNKNLFSLSSCIGYSRIGGDGSIEITTIEEPEGAGTMDTKTKLDILLLNTTINFKYSINKISPYIGLGPKFEYLISYDENITFLKTFENSENLNKMIYGILGIAGVNYELEKIRIGIEFNYNYNLNKLIDYSFYSPFLQQEIKNEISYSYLSFLFIIGYKIK